MSEEEVFENRMIDLAVSRSLIFSEFTKDEQNQYFSRIDKCVRTHIDTLYYSVSIVGDKNYTEDAGMLAMLAELLFNKQRKQSSPQENVDFFGLSAEAGSFAGYEYRLSFPEMYDFLSPHGHADRSRQASSSRDRSSSRSRRAAHREQVHGYGAAPRCAVSRHSVAIWQ